MNNFTNQNHNMYKEKVGGAFSVNVQISLNNLKHKVIHTQYILKYL